MRKIHEIDAPSVYVYPHENSTRMGYGRKKWKYRLEFIHAAFTVPQLKFLEDKNWCMRPHPQHNPTQEVFINEEGLTDQDWTMISLLFQRTI